MGKKSSSIGSVSAAALLALLGLTDVAHAQSHAQSVSEATADSILWSAAATPAAAASAPQQVWLQPLRLAELSLRVIELPEEHPQFGARARKHHALTWRNDTLSQALGNAGLPGAECHNRVRLPSRFRAAPDGSSALQVQLQIAVGCSF